MKGNGFLLTLTRPALREARNTAARDWREYRKAIRLLHKAGHYGAAAVLRGHLRKLETCFHYL